MKRTLVIEAGRATRMPYVMPGPGWILVEVEATGPVFVRIGDDGDGHAVETVRAARHATIGASFGSGERARVRIDNCGMDPVTVEIRVAAIETPPHHLSPGCAMPAFATALVALVTGLCVWLL